MRSISLSVKVPGGLISMGYLSGDFKLPSFQQMLNNTVAMRTGYFSLEGEPSPIGAEDWVFYTEVIPDGNTSSLSSSESWRRAIQAAMSIAEDGIIKVRVVKLGSLPIYSLVMSIKQSDRSDVITLPGLPSSQVNAANLPVDYEDD